jgi:hypothetical protein
MLESIALDSKLLTEGETPMLDKLRGFGSINSPVELLRRWIDRRNASDDGLFIPSSLLSEGRLYLGALVDTLLVGSLGSADGQRVARDTSWPRLEEVLDSVLGLLNIRLVPLSVRLSSVLAFLFSSITPPPAIMTGLIRSSRNGSWVRVLLATLSAELAALVLLFQLVPSPPELLLRPRGPYLPYPSCPVPAAGPFLGAFSVLPLVEISPGAVLVRLVKNPNRGLGFTGVGLGVRVAELLVIGCA